MEKLDFDFESAGHALCIIDCGADRILRAIHFYRENRRVQAQAEALKNNDFAAFLQMVKQSGRSSWMYLQNITPAVMAAFGWNNGRLRSASGDPLALTLSK